MSKKKTVKHGRGVSNGVVGSEVGVSGSGDTSDDRAELVGHPSGVGGEGACVVSSATISPDNPKDSRSNSRQPRTDRGIEGGSTDSDGSESRAEARPESRPESVERERGNVPSDPVAVDLGDIPLSDLLRTRESKSQASRRWYEAGQKKETENYRDEVRRECRKAGMDRQDSVDEAWRRCLLAFPPPELPKVELPPIVIPEPVIETFQDVDAALEEDETPETPRGITGLGEIPEGWPALPANANLSKEIAWVQANRLLIVTGDEECATVDLSAANTPAPSYATLGWLETSIRAYSKYCDIAARATAKDEGEKELVRRERKLIATVRSVLEEVAG